MKKLIVEEMRKANPMTEQAASKTIDEVFAAVKTVVKRGDKAAVPNFGTFAVKRRDERMGRNPQTGETVRIAAKDVLGFKASKGVI